MTSILTLLNCELFVSVYVNVCYIFCCSATVKHRKTVFRIRDVGLTLVYCCVRMVELHVVVGLLTVN